MRQDDRQTLGFALDLGGPQPGQIPLTILVAIQTDGGSLKLDGQRGLKLLQ